MPWRRSPLVSKHVRRTAVASALDTTVTLTCFHKGETNAASTTRGRVACMSRRNDASLLDARIGCHHGVLRVGGSGSEGPPCPARGVRQSFRARFHERRARLCGTRMRTCPSVASFLRRGAPCAKEARRMARDPPPPRAANMAPGDRNRVGKGTRPRRFGGLRRGSGRGNLPQPVRRSFPSSAPPLPPRTPRCRRRQRGWLAPECGVRAWSFRSTSQSCSRPVLAESPRTKCNHSRRIALFDLPHPLATLARVWYRRAPRSDPTQMPTSSRRRPGPRTSPPTTSSPRRVSLVFYSLSYTDTAVTPRT